LLFTTVRAPRACASSTTTRMLESVEPAVEIAQCLPPDRGGAFLPFGVRGRRLARGPQTPIEVVQCALQLGVGDCSRGALVEIVARGRDPVPTIFTGRSRSASQGTGADA
jgi:hypothetical protein